MFRKTRLRSIAITRTRLFSTGGLRCKTAEIIRAEFLTIRKKCSMRRDIAVGFDGVYIYLSCVVGKPLYALETYSIDVRRIWGDTSNAPANATRTESEGLHFPVSILLK
jgi:hypothetical protein